MRTYVIAFMLSMLCAWLATPLVRRLAIRLGAIDRPGERRVHTSPIPRMGGLAVAAAFCAPIVGLTIYTNRMSYALFGHWKLVAGLIIGGACIIAIGIYDDAVGARPFFKLSVQALAGVICFASGYEISVLANPLTGQGIELGWLSFPVTLIWMVGIINAINLIDGIDGLASGVAFFAVLVLFVITAAAGDIYHAVLTASLAGAIVGFLFFNFNPATIFLGDTGSMFLGFALAIISISASMKGEAVASIMVPALALGVPIMDTGLAVLRRWLTGKPLMGADRHHIHHQLMLRGLSQRQVVLALYSLCALLATMSLATRFLQLRSFLYLVLAAVGMLVILGMRYLGYAEHIRDERNSLLLKNLFAGISLRTDTLLEFRRAVSSEIELEAIWEALLELFKTFQLVNMRLEVTSEDGVPPEEAGMRTFEYGELVSDRELQCIELDIGSASGTSGRLTIQWEADSGPGHRSLYRLFFELVRRELDEVFEKPLLLRESKEADTSS